MALINQVSVTLSDVAKRLDPDGTLPDIVEMLAQTNQIVPDMRVREGNLPTGHQVTMRTGLPSVYFRLLNQGVPSSKSTTAQVQETCAILEVYSEQDKDVIALNGNSAAFRLSEDAAFIEAMEQKVGYTMIYGSASNPEEFIGLAPRYSSLSAANGANILSAGGAAAGDNTSMYLAVWGDRSLFGIYPKGSQAGLSVRDLGEHTVKDAQGNQFQALRTHFQWKLGLALADWRYVVRIPNIKVTDLVAQTGTQALSAATNILKLMSRAIDRLPAPGAGTPVFYTNRTVLSALRIMALEKTSSVLAIEEGLNQFGHSIHTLKFLGIPVKLIDQITNTENPVT